LRRAWGCWKIAITALAVAVDDYAVGVVVVLAADGAVVVVAIHGSAAAFLAVTRLDASRTRILHLRVLLFRHLLPLTTDFFERD